MNNKTFQTSLTNQRTLEWGTCRGRLIHDPEPNPEVPKNTAPWSTARHFTVGSIAASGGPLKSYLQRNTVQELCLFALGVVLTFPLNPSSLNLPYIIKTRSTCRIVETRRQVRSVLYSQIKGERKRSPSRVCVCVCVCTYIHTYIHITLGCTNFHRNVLPSLQAHLEDKICWRRLCKEIAYQQLFLTGASSEGRYFTRSTSLGRQSL